MSAVDGPIQNLGVRPTSGPLCPLTLLPLGGWAHASAAEIDRTANRLAGASGLVVGVTSRLPPARLGPLVHALNFTLVPDHVDNPHRQFVPVTDLDAAADRLRAITSARPQTCVVLGQLLRQTERLDTAGGLAAEAAAHSMLLGGTEFRARPAAGRPVAAGRSAVRVHRNGGTLSIAVDATEPDHGLRAALYEALVSAEADESVARVELRPDFRGGGDLDDVRATTDLVAAYLARLDQAPWRLIDRLRDRVTVWLHDAVTGAGLGMSAFAGRIVAAPGTCFALPAVGLGLVPGGGGTVSVPRRIGRWRAAWLMLTEEDINTATALRWGLIDDVSTG
ncbi:MAG TPA: enoyl-CoA hydratase/isomerase family protein [Pseudonocardiaceae bacterium]|nr:enoyl-CoA hydratase/isomerase family protein [Pseudonocardiaceae bacterium]